VTDSRATTLLPPNATAAERALEEAMRATIDFAAVGTLWDPATCPAEVLPFLGWGLAISHWDTDWTVAEKRAAVAAAVAFHKIKGTRAAVEQALARFSPLFSIVEWWETTPRGRPHSFQVRANVLEIDPDFLTTATTDAIIRDVAAAKPLRAHFDFVQSLEAQALVYLNAAGTAGAMMRADYDARHDISRDWSIVLQTEDGEPIRDESTDSYLEHN
jgi:phage tail P2-like protein